VRNIHKYLLLILVVNNSINWFCQAANNGINIYTGFVAFLLINVIILIKPAYKIERLLDYKLTVILPVVLMTIISILPLNEISLIVIVFAGTTLELYKGNNKFGIFILDSLIALAAAYGTGLAYNLYEFKYTVLFDLLICLLIILSMLPKDKKEVII